MLAEDVENITSNVNTGTFFLKCGMDGAASQSIYMQKFDNESNGEKCEETLFQTAIVPLRLDLGGKTVWNNKKPNSTHFCRPLHLQYMKETKENTRLEKQWIDDSKEKLQDVSIAFNTLSIK